ncbi:hypothetical protein PoB_000827200 [Plakobranchus ocellatus]|uniref:Uncharacterized protein n=1 Tax=Plakobranchus ocellatus TaxID=259542 RepID=A0AAV3YFZ2_9GAST|nr:hypothetical protein PoB_000827200 [Plakobranchus ocellatus]
MFKLRKHINSIKTDEGFDCNINAVQDSGNSTVTLTDKKNYVCRSTRSVFACRARAALWRLELTMFRRLQADRERDAWNARAMSLNSYRNS